MGPASTAHRRLAVIIIALAAPAAGIAGCGGDEAGNQGAPSVAPVTAPAGSENTQSPGVLDYTMESLNGKPQKLSRYRDKVVLIVNTATECGFTPQFKGLESLFEKRRSDGLVILGFPSNDFGGQEPRSNEAIAEFCRENYGVSFPMFAKIHVAGDDAHPLFKELAAAKGAPGWNFNKYLLDREGFVKERFGVEVEPQSGELTDAINEQLKAN